MSFRNKCCVFPVFVSASVFLSVVARGLYISLLALFICAILVRFVDFANDYVFLTESSCFLSKVSADLVFLTKTVAILQK